jgi:hypothetical protein
VNNEHVCLFIHIERINRIGEWHSGQKSTDARQTTLVAVQPLAELGTNKYDARLWRGNRFRHPAASVADEQFQCLTIRRRDFANADAVAH